MRNFLSFIFFLLFKISKGQSQIQYSLPIGDTLAFCAYLNTTNTANGYVGFFQNLSSPPLYEFNYHQFYDQPIEHRSSPYNLLQKARLTTNYYASLDTDKLLMFDTNEDKEIDASDQITYYFGFIEENGEFQNHTVLTLNPITKLFLYDTNYLVYLMFSYLNNVNPSYNFPYPSPFQRSANSKYRIFDPQYSNNGPLPAASVKNNLEGLMLNHLYFSATGQTTSAALYWKRFQLASSISLNFINSGSVTSSYYTITQIKDRDVQTSVLALTLMYYSNYVFNTTGRTNNDYIAYITLRSWLLSLQQVPLKPLSSGIYDSNYPRGGWLKYSDPLYYPNPISIRSTALSFYALGLNSYFTFDPFRPPMQTCASGISQAGPYGAAYAQITSNSCSRMIYGPYVTLPIGSYTFYYFYSGTNVFLGLFTAIQFEVYYGGVVRASSSTTGANMPGFGTWVRGSINFSITSTQQNVEFRVAAPNGNTQLVSSFKIVKN